jgi:uncharacterized integral membrane protein (TIGR00698 family)
MRRKAETTLPKWSLVVEIARKRLDRQIVRIAPGLLLALCIASVAFLLHLLPGLNILSPLILAILLGILLRNSIGVPVRCHPGIKFALKRLLRLAIALLGLQVSLSQLHQVGIIGFLAIAIVLVATFGFTCWLGRYLKVGKALTYLIAVGTSICGASAIVAMAATIDNSDEDTTYAVGIITLYGTLSMLLYPLVLPFLSLTPEAFGIWCGSSIHEVAQAIAAAFQSNSVSGELASIAKLSRVLWLAPIIPIASTLYARSQTASNANHPVRSVVPWFAVGFVALILLNSWGLFPTSLKTNVGQANLLLLSTAMAAMGLETRLQNIQKIGLKPLYLGALSWLFITVLSLGFATALY